MSAPSMRQYRTAHKENTPSWPLKPKETWSRGITLMWYKGWNATGGNSSFIYSLGNFVFHQWWSKETCQDIILKISIRQIRHFISREARLQIMDREGAGVVLKKLELSLLETNDLIGVYFLQPRTEGRLIKYRQSDLDGDGKNELVAIEGDYNF